MPCAYAPCNAFARCTDAVRYIRHALRGRRKAWLMRLQVWRVHMEEYYDHVRARAKQRYVRRAAGVLCTL